MTNAKKLEFLNASLERVAEKLGDITPPVVDRYYARFPEAKEAFEFHSVADRRSLGGEMVERTLYCLMTWLKCPGEIEIMLMGSVPHHSVTLSVPTEHFNGFLMATIDTIEETIPKDNAEELAVLQGLRLDLGELIETSAAI